MAVDIVFEIIKRCLFYNYSPSSVYANIPCCSEGIFQSVVVVVVDLSKPELVSDQDFAAVDSKQSRQ